MPMHLKQNMVNNQNLAFAVSTAFCKDFLVDRIDSRWGLTSVKMASCTDLLLSNSQTTISLA